MDNYTEQWRQVFARRKTGLRLMLLHLIVFPAATYLVGYFLTIATGKDPVWLYLIAFVYWIAGIVYLHLRYDPYNCPRCGTKIVLGNKYKSFLPLPCHVCGLVRPLLEP